MSKKKISYRAKNKTQNLEYFEEKANNGFVTLKIEFFAQNEDDAFDRVLEAKTILQSAGFRVTQ